MQADRHVGKLKDRQVVKQPDRQAAKGRQASKKMQNHASGQRN